jgi:hypothetical protein
MQEQEMRLKLAQLAKQLGLRMAKVQLLLCQERFLARLGSIPEGRSFIWKGGSLILRLYRIESLPRYTIDIDLTISGLPFSEVKAVFEKAMAINLKDGFAFKSMTTEPMERDPATGDNNVWKEHGVVRFERSKVWRKRLVDGIIINSIIAGY